MKKYYETEIGKLIEKKFDARLTNCIFNYILEYGINTLKNYAEDDIEKISSGIEFVSDALCQSLVRTAVQICKECRSEDIWDYIRRYMVLKPYPQEVTLSKGDFLDDWVWKDLLKTLQLDSDETTITVTVIPEN